MDGSFGGKRLALFLDGTWNIVSDNTNIWRLRSIFLANGLDGREQRAYYSTGLGTKFGEKIRGGMFGRGIDTAITAAYEWLVDNYDEGDEIFIFGFSRGAYTARSLSGFISKCGLVKKGAPLGVNQLYVRYRDQKARTIRTLISGESEKVLKPDFEEAWLLQYSRAVPIKFIGVFDTVGSLGVPFPLARRLIGAAYPFLNTGLRLNNEYAYHALAIDEHRKPFAPTLWTNQGAPSAKPRPLEKTEQRWFIGAHANIGGGCFSDELATLPMTWIRDKASSLGLGFASGFPTGSEAFKSSISDSFAEFMNGWYRIMKLGIRYRRPIDLPPSDEGPNVSNINETIDGTVFARWRETESYRPRSIIDWARRHNVDPKSIQGAVWANDPGKSAA